jgi:hypothetical protein
MANVFAILSAIALAAAAFLAMKNKGAYETEIAARKTEQEHLATSEAKYTSLVTDVESTEAELKSTDEETVGLTEKETAQAAKNKAVEGDVATKKQQSDANAAKIADFEEKTKEIGNIEELVGKMERTKQELEEFALSISTSEAKLADLTSEKTRTEGVIGSYNSKNSNYSNKRSFFTSTRISAIYPAYGFVTLPVGNSAGVVSGSPLDVVRDGSVVAKLRVKSVEAGRAAAEIVPDSVAQDSTLMVGDKVVPGSEPAAK